MEKKRWPKPNPECALCLKTFKRPKGANYKYCPECSIENRNPNSTVKQRLYGLSPAALQEMFDKQDNKCAICKHEFSKARNKHRFNIDHCHKTGVNRDLLCQICNLSVGILEADEERFQKCQEYIEYHRREKIGPDYQGPR